MGIPYIPGLGAEEWAGSTFDQRLESLNALETAMAGQENRTPATVVASEGMKPNERGYFNRFDNEIGINPSLIGSNQPYQAVETTFHEDQHAHQHFCVQHPEQAKEDPAVLNDWRMSEQNGYTHYDGTNFSEYRFQPTELDANQAARGRTDEFYEKTMQDTQKYPEFKQMKGQEVSDDIARAKDELGEDYVEEARQTMQINYLEAQGQQESGQPAPGEDNEESKKQGYGYGY